MTSLAIPSALTSEEGWKTSSRSGGEGQCVEVKITAHAIGVRDSKNPDKRRMLCLEPGVFAAFINDVCNDRFPTPPIT